MSTKHKLAGTPIGTLLDMGLSNKKIAEITSVSESGAKKWRNGINDAGMSRKIHAQGYLDGLAKSTTATAKPQPSPAPDMLLFLVSVPPTAQNRFSKMMALLGLDHTDIDAAIGG